MIFMVKCVKNTIRTSLFKMKKLMIDREYLGHFSNANQKGITDDLSSGCMDNKQECMPKLRKVDIKLAFKKMKLINVIADNIAIKVSRCYEQTRLI